MQKRIYYNQKQLKKGLWMVMLFCFVAILNIIFMEEMASWQLFWIPLALFHAITHYRNVKYGIAKITDEYIEKTEFMAAKIPISEVRKMKFVFGDYLVESEKKEITIPKALITEESALFLDDFISNFEPNR